MHVKSFFAILILVSISIFADFNGNRGVMVSASPQPGHSQLRYYKEERQHRHKQQQSRNGRSDYPWAQEYRYNSANPLHHSSSIMTVLVVAIMTFIYT